MKISKNAILTGLVSTMLFTSCATIMHGSRQTIGICSNPAHARVAIDGRYIGQTPMIVKLTRKDNHFLRIELDGYMPYEAVFTRQVSGWVFGNVIFGGVIGLAVDAISGGIYKLTPDQIQAQMCTNQMSCQVDGDNSYFAVVLEADPSWEKIGDLQIN